MYFGKRTQAEDHRFPSIGLVAPHATGAFIYTLHGNGALRLSGLMSGLTFVLLKLRDLYKLGLSLAACNRNQITNIT